MFLETVILKTIDFAYSTKNYLKIYGQERKTIRISMCSFFKLFVGHPVLFLHLTSSKINLAIFQLMFLAVTFQGEILGIMTKQDGTLNPTSDM